MIRAIHTVKEACDLEISYLPEYYKTDDTMIKFVSDHIRNTIFSYQEKHLEIPVIVVSSNMYNAIKTYHKVHDKSFINITPSNILDIGKTNTVNNFSVIKATLISGEQRYICRDVKCTLYISDSFSTNSLFYNNEIDDDTEKDIAEYVKTYNAISKSSNEIISYDYIPISITEYIGMGEYK